MLVAYQWGLKFIELFSYLEDFFLYQPFADAVKLNRFSQMLYNDGWSGPFVPYLALPDWLLEIVSNMSIGDILVSTSVIGIIIIKVLKFFIGILTGS